MSYHMDKYGMIESIPDTTGMLTPVRCTHCRQVYDVTAVHVIARHADCSTWITPCCGVHADDRMFIGRPHIEYLDGRNRR